MSATDFSDFAGGDSEQSDSGVPMVLFVDDDHLLLQGLMRSLAREPYQMLCATSGDAALAILRRQRVNVLVTDEQMPGMPGNELITQVHREFPAVMSILLTGQATVGSLVHALNHGHVFRVLLKPCRTEEIADAIRVTLMHQAIWERCRAALPILRRLGDLLEEVERTDVRTPQTPGLCQKSSANQDLSDLAAALDSELERARLVLAQH